MQLHGITGTHTSPEKLARQSKKSSIAQSIKMSARKELPSESLLIFRNLVIHISLLISLFSAMNCVSQQKIPFVSLHRGIGASMSTRFTTKRGMSARK